MKFMDCLLSKYSSPFILLDGMIQTNRLCEFVDEFIDFENERQTWEFYLHKVFEKTYGEFKESLKAPVRPSDEQLKTIIQDSKNMINDFKPQN